MIFSNYFPFSLPQALGLAGLSAVAIFTTAALARQGPARESPAFVKRRLGLPKGVARWLTLAALTVVALFAFGIDMKGLWSGLAAALSLVAIGFVAMWSILSHMLASILIVIFRPFEVGDRVEIVSDDTVVGEVLDLNPVYTTLRTDDGGTLQVPNNLFFQKAVKRHASVASIASVSSLATAEPVRGFEKQVVEAS